MEQKNSGKTVDQSVLDEAIEDPRRLASLTKAETFSIPSDVADKFRLAAIQMRFEKLKDRVPMLTKLAEEEQISEIKTIEDLAPLLFHNTVYKSYPVGWLEKNNFKRLTNWLDKLTSHDLSGVDTAGCELIEDWLELMWRETPLQVNYSAAKGGKMSFNPREKEDWQIYTQLFMNVLQPFSEDLSWKPLVRGKDKVPVFHWGPKKSGRPMSRLIEVYEQWFGEGLVITPMEQMDADLMSIAGRLEAAAKKGEKGKLTVNPRVLKMKEQILKVREDMPKLEEAMFQDLVTNYRGQRVIMFGTRGHLFKLVEGCEKRKLKSAFAPGSVFLYGSFFMGEEPENWEERTREALGLKKESMMEVYGMSEVLNFFDRCEDGHYHLPVTLVPYVLNPESGDQYPRKGVQTGQFAFFDLMADSYWGGFVTGDGVTVNWEGRCPCGRHGAFIEGDVVPLSQMEGGDDKINCAGSTKAHENAIEYILEM